MQSYRVIGLMLGIGAGVASTPAVEAQHASLAVHVGQAVDEAGNGHAAITLSPSVEWSGQSAAAAVRGQITALESASVMGAVSGSSRVQLLLAGPISLLLSGEALAVASEAGYRGGAAVLAPLARVAVGPVGVEVGPHFGTGVRRVGSRVGPDGALAGLLVPRGGSVGETQYRSETGWTADGWVERGPVWVRIGRRALSSGEHSWEEWNVESGAVLRPFTLRVRSGAREGSLSELSYGGRVTAQVSERMALSVEGGRSFSSTLLGQPGGTYGTVGASWSVGGAR